jgi:hypothetical protein
MTGQLLREHLRTEPGRNRIRDQDKPKNTPVSTFRLLARAALDTVYAGLCLERAREHLGPEMNEAPPARSTRLRRPMCILQGAITCTPQPIGRDLEQPPHGSPMNSLVRSPRQLA